MFKRNYQKPSCCLMELADELCFPTSGEEPVTPEGPNGAKESIGETSDEYLRPVHSVWDE